MSDELFNEFEKEMSKQEKLWDAEFAKPAGSPDGPPAINFANKLAEETWNAVKPTLDKAQGKKAIISHSTGDSGFKNLFTDPRLDDEVKGFDIEDDPRNDVIEEKPTTTLQFKPRQYGRKKEMNDQIEKLGNDNIKFVKVPTPEDYDGSKIRFSAGFDPFESPVRVDVDSIPVRSAEESMDMFNRTGNIIVHPTERKAWIGVDPGKSGGIGLITHGRIDKWIIPKIGDDVDLHKLHGLFVNLKKEYGDITIILEEVHSIFNSSAASNFTFGFVCGAIEAIVISHHLKLIKVQPKAWQKAIWLTSEIEYKYGKVSEKTGKPSKSVDTKLTSLKACKRLFPHVDLRGTERSTKDHDGIVDGLLLAEYGRRNNL